MIGVGDLVKVKEKKDDVKHSLLFANFCGTVEKIEGGRAFVNSDGWTEHTGQVQAVSFKQWFPLDLLAVFTGR